MATNNAKNQVWESEFLPELGALYNFAYHLTYNEAEANDLVQETCLRAIKNIEQYRSGTNAKAWLFRILKNQFINNYRKKQRQGGEPVGFEDVAATLPEPESNGFPTDFDWTDAELYDLLGDEVALAMAQLKDEYRIVVILADLQDFKYEEIAEMLELPIGTVRSRLHRGRTALADHLQEYAKQNGYTNYRK
jgi:RNA polymerase sigma-70 factor (ECF subfamily)